ncbi:MAG: NAD(P)-dependent alcohol dehydrogenase [Deltaproteobacteria bacterium]|nr:NAD(P)-dependent alcohol dehydrogenase [Deltaproteobacteria bacterium]
MRAWAFAEFGVEHLVLTERSEPRPGPGQLLVRLSAASLNYRDLLMVRGAYNPRQRLPLVPCSDGVGEVAAVGEGVSRFSVGDRVCPLFSQTWVTGPPDDDAGRGTLGGPLDGTLQEVMLVDERAAVAAPEHLSDAEAACLPCAAVTAWRALVTEGGIRPGDTVLTLGTGGVSLFALQLGTALGAGVVVTSSSDEKLARALAMGAAHGVNYRTDPKWGKAVRAWSGRGVDLVVELGGAATLGQSLGAVRTGGCIALIGNLGGNVAEIALPRILMRAIRIQGLFVGNRDDFESLTRFLSVNPDLRPTVDRVFPFEEAPEAFAHLASGTHFGKVAVSIR